MNIAHHVGLKLCPVKLFFYKPVSIPLYIGWIISDDHRLGFGGVEVWKKAWQKMVSAWNKRKKMFEILRDHVILNIEDLVMVKRDIQPSLKSNESNGFSVKWIVPFKIESFPTPNMA